MFVRQLGISEDWAVSISNDSIALAEQQNSQDAAALSAVGELQGMSDHGEVLLAFVWGSLLTAGRTAVQSRQRLCFVRPSHELSFMGLWSMGSLFGALSMSQQRDYPATSRVGWPAG